MLSGGGKVPRVPRCSCTIQRQRKEKIMNRRRLALAASLAILAASAWAADDATGKWVAKMDTAQGPVNLTFDLKADGMKLMGTLSNENLQPTPISEGAIHGAEVSFKVTMDVGGGAPTTLVYKGMLKGDSMSLTRTFEGTPLQGSAPEAKLMAMREKDAKK
jgi:hypothetical protein